MGLGMIMGSLMLTISGDPLYVPVIAAKGIECFGTIDLAVFDKSVLVMEERFG
jgi:hypothetical protein